jgi:hypothetical protein
MGARLQLNPNPAVDISAGASAGGRAGPERGDDAAPAHPLETPTRLAPAAARHNCGTSRVPHSASRRRCSILVLHHRDGHDRRGSQS